MLSRVVPIPGTATDHRYDAAADTLARELSLERRRADAAQTRLDELEPGAERDPRTGRAAYTPLVAVGLMVFYVYALMCMSTVAVTVRETGGGARGVRWAALQFGYMLALAYLAALLVYQGGRLLGFA